MGVQGWRRTIICEGGYLHSPFGVFGCLRELERAYLRSVTGLRVRIRRSFFFLISVMNGNGRRRKGTIGDLKLQLDDKSWPIIPLAYLR